MIGMWFGEDQRANIIKACSKEIGLRLQILITSLHSTINIIGKAYASNHKINKDALPITITK